MNIATISGMLAASGGKGQSTSLPELADASGVMDFQSLLTSAGKGSHSHSGNFRSELKALLAGELPASAIDSAIAFLLAENRIPSGETNSSGNPVLSVTEEGLSTDTDALLAAIAQAMSCQVAPTSPFLPSPQGNPTLTPEDGNERIASLMNSLSALSQNLSTSLQQATDSDIAATTIPSIDVGKSGNSTLFQVDHSNAPALTSLLQPNSVATPRTQQPNGIAHGSTTRSSIQNSIAATLPTEAATTSPQPQSGPTPINTIPQTPIPPMVRDGAQESQNWWQLENAVTNTHSRSTPSPGQLPATPPDLPAAYQGATPGHFVNDNLLPLEFRVEAANTADTLSSSLTLAPATATHLHPRSAETQTSPSAINTPFHDRTAWAQDFGDRIVWMAKQDQQSAEIRITPANLGPVQISLNIEDGKANAVFVSPHAEVRQALEEALPRLREMLNASGISLGQANVGSQMPQQQPDTAARFAAIHRNSGENAILSAIEGNGSSTSVLPIRQGRGMVDLFA